MPLPTKSPADHERPNSVLFEECWAKTNRDGKPGISVANHCRNVGYVAAALLDQLPPEVRALFPEGSVALAASHDIGKVSPEFQSQCPAWLIMHPAWTALGADHAACSQWALALDYGEDAMYKWAQVAGAHHGRIKPPVHSRPWAWDDQRSRLLRELKREFGPLPSTVVPESILFLVAGLITIADWIGSDEIHFSQDSTEDGAQLRHRAHVALEAIGWRPIQARRHLIFGQLFPETPHANSLQAATHRAVNHPGIHVIEAPMGLGKTEAALTAAYSLLSSNRATGLYFALPTQVTSNRIFERVRNWAGNALSDDVSVRLAHGSSWLNDNTKPLQPTLQPCESGDDSENPLPAQLWFASSKRSLLSPIGVGTVDQALLGVIAVKHFFVRQFGLAGKVVVLDEVHSYDLYTGALITSLVKHLRELGATVIILSATLTQERRRELLNIGPNVPLAQSYPLISSVDESDTLVETPCEVPPSKTVSIRRLQSSPYDEALTKASSGACVIWIRNTVNLAQQTFQILRQRAENRGIAIGLLHSRFPYFRRQELEAHWITALGKIDAYRPGGCVLVSTQIAEQSVDIDADLLISDLAPTDMLLQRIGRLWRHHREHRPLPSPETWIEMPSLDALGAHGKVYAPYVLARSAEQWETRSTITLPDEIRVVLEATYAPPRLDEPQSWRQMREQLDTKKKELENAALTNTRVWQRTALQDEEGVATRWSEISYASIVLLQSHSAASWTFLDGTTAKVTAKWNFEAARAIHGNLVRLPSWMLAGVRTPLLRGYIDGFAATAILRDDGFVHLPDGEAAKPLLYDSRLGLHSNLNEPGE